MDEANLADALLFGLAFASSLALSLIESSLLVGAGSDHAVHVFLIDTLRENGHRLYRRIPRILNPSTPCAYPPFLHLSLSFAPRAWLSPIARYLNPAINASMIVLMYGVLKSDFFGASPALAGRAGLVCLAYALAPQLFHATSARNYGLSSRGIGIGIVTLLLLNGYLLGATPRPYAALVLQIILGYLLWGFNKFSQQAYIAFAALVFAISGQARLVLLLLISLGLFLAIHRGYGLRYLVGTARFFKAYATDLAKVFILLQRYSVWRDLVWDIPLKLIRNPSKGVSYAYTNSVLIVVLLNPLSVVAPLAYLSRAPKAAFFEYCALVSLAGLITMFVTSFRATRFLGEPERYVEVTTFFSTVAACAFLRSGGLADWCSGFIVYCVVVDLLQLVYAWMIKKRTKDAVLDVDAAHRAIEHALRGSQVRFGSNNEEILKRFMTMPWHFLRYMSADHKYGNEYFARDAFSSYPAVKQAPFEAMVRRYEINAVVLDKSLCASMYHDDQESRSRLTLLLDQPGYAVLTIDWSGASHSGP